MHNGYIFVRFRNVYSFLTIPLPAPSYDNVIFFYDDLFLFSIKIRLLIKPPEMHIKTHIPAAFSTFIYHNIQLYRLYLITFKRSLMENRINDAMQCIATLSEFFDFRFRHWRYNFPLNTVCTDDTRQTETYIFYAIARSILQRRNC